jgi:hypothetical protein
VVDLGVPRELIRLIKMCFSESYMTVRIGEHMSDQFPIQSSLKRDTSLPLLFNLSLQCAIRKVQENQERLKLNGTHLLLVYAVDMNLLEDNINIVKKEQIL